MYDLDNHLKDIVVRSIGSLASVCDHAQTIDRQGFSKATAGPGHEIAALGSDRWTSDYWDYAARLSSHHSRQLEKNGQLDPADGERLRQAVRSTSVSAPEISTRWIDLALIDGQRMIVLSMPSDERLPRILKNLPGDEVYRPAGAGRLWRISERWAFAVKAFLGEFARVGDGVEQAISESLLKATAEDKMLAIDLPVVRFDPGKAEFYVKFEYDRDFVAVVKSHGGRFEKGTSWKDCSAFVPADRIGAAFVYRLLGDGSGAILHPEANRPLEEARAKEPSADVIAASGPPRLVFEAAGGGRLRVKMTRFNPEFLQAVKSVPGRSYDSGAWLIPASNEAVELLASRLDDVGSPEAAEAAAELRGMAGEFGAAESPAAEIVIEDANGKFVTMRMSLFVREWVEAIKYLPKGDRRYDAESKAWKVRKNEETFTQLLENLQSACARTGSPAYFVAAVERVERFLESLHADNDDFDRPGPRM